MNPYLFETLVLICLSIISILGANYLLALWKNKRIQTTQAKWQLVNQIISQAVIGAEQLWRAGIIEKDQRLDKAVEISERELRAWGVTGISTKRIVDACNAGVGAELNMAKLVSRPQDFS